jgi:hypothetical protein
MVARKCYGGRVELRRVKLRRVKLRRVKLRRVKRAHSNVQESWRMVGVRPSGRQSSRSKIPTSKATIFVVNAL